jgi:steroid delta-isomerase-like uncharacterized protein
MPQGQSTVAHELIDLFNAGNLDGVRTIVDPDIVYEETGTGRRVQGFDDYLELMRGWRQALPDVAGTVTSSVESGNRVALEINWAGTQSGPLITPTGEIPASGKPIDIQASIWCTLRDGKITEVHHYLDVLTMLQQIGALA